MKETERGEAPASYYDDMFTDGKHYVTRDFRTFKGFRWWKRIAWRFEGCAGVIDLGCGPGHFAAFLHSLGVPKYHGIDFSEVAIERAYEWAEAAGVEGDFWFTVADLNAAGDWPGEWEVPEGVIFTSMATLEHLEHDIALLEKLPSGVRFIGLVPSIDSRSHVRYFERPADVRERYGHLFEPDLNVTTFREGAGSKTRRVYVFDGRLR